MIDNNLYRCRIGSFYQTIRDKKSKFMKYEDSCSKSKKAGKITLRTITCIVKIFVLIFLFNPYSEPSAPATQSSTSRPPPAKCTWTSSSPDMLCSWMLPATAYPKRSRVLCSPVCYKLGSDKFSSAQQMLHLYVLGKKQTSNFLSKYLHGNIKKGILNLHLNIRSLNTKIVEIKKIVKENTPHIFGLSECELRKVNNQFDETKLKIPGYQVLYPKSWESLGFARVLVYVKKGFEFEQIHELEEDKVQSIWIKGGFKKSKKIYFCHGYREHTTTLGNSLTAQRATLELFLQQWEIAAEHGSPAEPNEVHISGDMNLDSLNGRWLHPGYPLLSLSRMVQDTCNMHNFSQLVTEATRLQYNSVQNSTAISCIDHVYTNTKYMTW